MQTATLEDGTRVHCLVKSEAVVLDHHVQGYLTHGIAISADDIVFDVGANIGVFGVRAVQSQPGVRVFAFEPVPAIYSVLKQNSDDYGEGRLIALPFGASNEPGTIQIKYYPNSPALSTGHPEFWDDNPGMLEDAVAGSVRNAPPSFWYARFVPKFLAPFIARRLRKGAQTVDCQLRTISSVMDEYDLDRIDLLKIDCEGAELLALLGIEERHWSGISQVVTEVHDIEGRLEIVCELLRRHGLDDIACEREKGFEETALVNVHARRTVP